MGGTPGCLIDSNAAVARTGKRVVPVGLLGCQGEFELPPSIADTVPKVTNSSIANVTTTSAARGLGVVLGGAWLTTGFAYRIRTRQSSLTGLGPILFGDSGSF